MPPRAELWLADPHRKAFTRFSGTLDGERFLFAQAPQEGAGELRVPGFLPAEVRWDDARCEPPLLKEAAPIVGTVLGAEDAPAVVMGCGTQAEVGPGGSFFLEAPPEPCTLRAVRTDGLGGRGPAVEIIPQVGQDTVVDLLLPPPLGGIGIRFHLDEAGHTRITEVFPGSPAARASLSVGARILTVNGEPLPDDDLRQVARRIVGPVGTEVTLTLQSETALHEITLIRAAP